MSVPPPKTALAGRPLAGRVAMPVWRINRELQGGKVVSMGKGALLIRADKQDDQETVHERGVVAVQDS